MNFITLLAYSLSLGITTLAAFKKFELITVILLSFLASRDVEVGTFVELSGDLALLSAILVLEEGTLGSETNTFSLPSGSTSAT